MISILMPIYNGVEFINESIESILKQTFSVWELIIGINGHPQNSQVFINVKNYIDSLEQDFRNKIIILDLYEIKGKSLSLNKMLKYAKYDWIALLDVDDYWHPEKLEKQIGMICKGYHSIGTLCKYFGDSDKVPIIPDGDLSIFNFYSKNPIINSSALIKKELCYWKEYNGVEDYDLWLRLNRLNYKFYNIPEILTFHRIHSNSAFNAKGNNNLVPDLLNKHLQEGNVIVINHNYF